MFEDLKTLWWFLIRPRFYSAMLTLILRKFLKNRDLEIERQVTWCSERVISLDSCFKELGLEPKTKKVFSNSFVDNINEKIFKSNSNFGGQGHVFLLYAVCENLEAMKVLETGVAYGWSSAAILSSISKRSGKLISVDMPMIKQTDYHLIGVAVDENLKSNWELLREPDRNGLGRAIKKHNYSYDMAHYDSDKTYYGRKWSQPLIWKYLRKGGVFISDDIEDSLAFKEFVVSNNLDVYVLKFEGKYVGIIRKST